MSLRRIDALPALLVLLSLAACGGPSAEPHQAERTDGPLVTGGDKSRICLEDHGSSRYTFAVDVLRNPSSRALHVRDVELLTPRGFALRDAKVLPLTGSLIGAWSSYPPPASAPASDTLADAKEAAGYDLEAKGEVALLVQLERDVAKKQPALGGLRIKYSDDGENFQASTTTALTVKDSCAGF